MANKNLQLEDDVINEFVSSLTTDERIMTSEYINMSGPVDFIVKSLNSLSKIYEFKIPELYQKFDELKEKLDYTEEDVEIQLRKRLPLTGHLN